MKYFQSDALKSATFKSIITGVMKNYHLKPRLKTKIKETNKNINPVKKINR